MKIPTIEDLVRKQLDTISKDEEKLSKLKKDTPEYNLLKAKINYDKTVLGNVQDIVRDVKLNDIGLK